MPIYGEQKKRQIARSVLPSRRANGARNDLRNIKQRARSNMRQELRVVGRDAYSEDVIDSYDESNFDWEFYPYTEIRYAVYDRQNGDNLSALMRWAPKQVENIRLEDRLSKMYQIMPDNLIGRHAVGHLEYHDDFYVEGRGRYWRFGGYKYTAEETMWLRACEYAALYDRLYSLFEKKGALKRFNAKGAYIKSYEAITKEEWDALDEWERSVYRTGYTRQWNRFARRWEYFQVNSVKRPLMGIHDIEDFIRDVTARHNGAEQIENLLEHVGV